MSMFFILPNEVANEGPSDDAESGVKENNVMKKDSAVDVVSSEQTIQVNQTDNKDAPAEKKKDKRRKQRKG